jgi:hypothetical protein
VIFMLAVPEGCGEDAGRSPSNASSPCALFLVGGSFTGLCFGSAGSAFPAAESGAPNGSSADFASEEAVFGFSGIDGGPNGSPPWPGAGSPARINGNRPQTPSTIAAKKTALHATDFRMIVLLVQSNRGQ